MTSFTAYAHPERVTVPSPDLDNHDGRVEYLGDLLCGLRFHFTFVFTSWLGLGGGLARVARVPDTTHLLSEHEARLMRLPAGTEVLLRRGWLVARGDRYGRHLAAVDSLVHPGRLGLAGSELEAFTAGHTPLGALAAGARHTQYVFPVVPGEPEYDDLSMPPALPDEDDDVPVLRSLATLERRGKPFAVAAERVYKPAIDHANVAVVRNLLAPLLDGVA
ncbi:hypothetical protein [Saccharothrix sp. HUAS TT1]|uniref:hypothetical protein n=1 Tax=unclassified Saccharothrix TaxID=2593673 RepID=UPI00345C1F10